MMTPRVVITTRVSHSDQFVVDVGPLRVARQRAAANPAMTTPVNAANKRGRPAVKRVAASTRGPAMNCRRAAANGGVAHRE